MKNLFAVLLASLMLFSFAACSSETDSSSDTNQSNVETVTTDEESGSDSTEETTDETDSETGTDASDETGTDAADETGSDAADETGSDATDETGSDQTDETGSSETGSATNTGVYTGTADPAEEQTITGTILDATMSTVTIQTEDGEELSFSIPDDADETEVDGMTVGDTLEITYTGTIDGTDTSGATVVKLVQTSAQ